MNKEQSTEICCPPFDVSQWDDVMHDWNEKHFIKDNIKETKAITTIIKPTFRILLEVDITPFKPSISNSSFFLRILSHSYFYYSIIR